MEKTMLNVLANSFMIASRTVNADRRPETTHLAGHETARTRRSREIAAFLAAARDSSDRHMNA
jgi:hypothetical protein